MFVYFDRFGTYLSYKRRLNKIDEGVYDKFIITTVTWSEELDHVSLTGADHQIKLDASRLMWSDDPRLSIRRDPTLRIKLL